jgi:hypothetical protein
VPLPIRVATIALEFNPRGLPRDLSDGVSKGEQRSSTLGSLHEDHTPCSKIEFD